MNAPLPPEPFLWLDLFRLIFPPKSVTLSLFNVNKLPKNNDDFTN